VNILSCNLDFCALILSPTIHSFFPNQLTGLLKFVRGPVRTSMPVAGEVEVANA